MDMITVSAKTVDEAVTKALIELKTTSDKLEYEVVEEGSKGFLGLGAKPAVIRAKKKETVADRAIEFLTRYLTLWVWTYPLSRNIMKGSRSCPWN